MAIPDDMDAFAELLWSSLNEDNKVSGRKVCEKYAGKISLKKSTCGIICYSEDKNDY